jgi:hypothetical protein
VTTGFHPQKPDLSRCCYSPRLSYIATDMVSLDLSNHLEAHSRRQVNRHCDNDAPRRAPREERLDALKVSRVKANRGTGEENVPCLSFRQASTLGVVVVLLSTFLLDFTLLSVVVGAAASTVSMANEIRSMTLEKRKELQIMRQSMYESSLELKLAMREMERSMQDRSTTMPPSSFPRLQDENPSLGNDTL